MESLGHPHVTQHALEQWDARTPDDAVSLETAWRHSSRSRRLATLLRVDEARYNASTDTVLIRDGGRLATVYDVTPHAGAGASAEDVYRVVREQFAQPATDGGEQP